MPNGDTNVDPGRIDDLQSRIDTLTKTIEDVVDRLDRIEARQARADGGAVGESLQHSTEQPGDKLDPQYEAPVVAQLDPGETLSLSEFISLIQRCTRISDEETAQKRVAKLVDYDIFESTGDLQEWKYNP